MNIHITHQTIQKIQDLLEDMKNLYEKDYTDNMERQSIIILANVVETLAKDPLVDPEIKLILSRVFYAFYAIRGKCLSIEQQISEEDR